MKTEEAREPEVLGIVTGSESLVEGGVGRTKKKVAIVGFAPSSMTDVRQLFGDPDFEIWAINQLYIAFPAITENATRWFQIHHRHSYDQAARDHKHHDWLAEQNRFPIYMQVKESDIPMSIEFPKDEITDHFGRYFTNSISWQIALAIYEGFEAIHVYGVDMAQNEEYSEQRPSCEYFLGWARGAGIKVYIPDKSDLCKTTWLYPYEDDAPFRVKCDSRRVELRDRVNALSMNEQSAHDERMQLLGALENMNYVQQCWNMTIRANAPVSPPPK